MKNRREEAAAAVLMASPCEAHERFEASCQGCHDALHRQLEAKGIKVKFIAASLPPQPTEAELLEYMNRKRQEAGGK